MRITPLHSRGARRPSFARKTVPRKTEGAGNAGCPMHPQPRVRKVKNTRVSHHRFAETLRHSLRGGFNGYFALSPVTGLFCHRRSRGFLLENLTPASGRQDHTTSPSGSAPLVLRRQGVHRIPLPTFVTTAKRPSLSRRDAASKPRFLIFRKRNIFAWGDWTTQISLNRLMKNAFTRTRFCASRGANEARCAKIELICPSGQNQKRRGEHWTSPPTSNWPKAARSRLPERIGPCEPPVTVEIRYPGRPEGTGTECSK